MNVAAFQGLFPATVTPFGTDGQVDEAALAPYLAHLFDAGVQGVYVGGTTGEGLETALDKRKQAAEAILRAIPHGKLAIVHVGATAVETACDLARHAAAHGAQAVSSLPPLGGFGFEETAAYYRRLAAATDLPLFLYYFRARSTAVGGLDELLSLCRLPNVAGVKFTDFDLYTLEQLAAAGHTVLNGRDEVLTAGLLMGARGGIGAIYNVAPRLFVQLYEAARAGHWGEAMQHQRQVNRLVRVLLRYPLLPALKRTLRWMGFAVGEVQAPYVPLSEAQANSLRAALEALDFISLSATPAT